jgi:hypothetical protein
MYLHDWADIFTQFVRVFTETTFVLPTLLSAIGMTISWGYTRLYVFPQVIWACGIGQVYKGRRFYSEDYLVYQLCILLILHIYWYYVLLRSLGKFIFKGKIEDYQQKIKQKSQ